MTSCFIPSDGWNAHFAGFEVDSVLDAATVAVERLNLIDRAELALRSMFRAWRRTWHAGLYGNLPPQPAASRASSLQSAPDFSTTRPSHGLSASDIFGMHDTAAIKIDAAEYAFTMMLTELRGVMSTPATNWQPARAPHIAAQEPFSGYAVCAA